MVIPGSDKEKDPASRRAYCGYAMWSSVLPDLWGSGATLLLGEVTVLQLGREVDHDDGNGGFAQSRFFNSGLLCRSFLNPLIQLLRSVLGSYSIWPAPTTSPTRSVPQ